jgi:hypothetical protein
MMWHRADCGHIQPDGVLRFVEGDDMKACSLNAGELAVWACSRGKQMDYSDTCRTKRFSEQSAKLPRCGMGLLARSTEALVLASYQMILSTPRYHLLTG